LLERAPGFGEAIGANRLGFAQGFQQGGVRRRQHQARNQCIKIGPGLVFIGQGQRNRL
jgi:hypothetical protein